MRIGLVLNILDEEYQISSFRGIKKRAESLGIDLVCIQQENFLFARGDFISDICKKEVFNLDGIILLTSVICDNVDFKNRFDVESMWKKIPVVSIGQKIEGIPSILIRCEKAMKDLVFHLVKKHNFKNFIFFAGPKNHHDSAEREKVFLQALDSYKKEIPELNCKILRGDFVQRTATLSFSNYCSENPDAKIDVVVCANDNMAIGIHKYIKMNASFDKRLSEIAVTGFDNIPQSEYEIPSLTTICQPIEEIGMQAVDYLYKIINQKDLKLPEVSYVDAKLILRESCFCKKKSENSKKIKSQKEDEISSMVNFQLRYINSEQTLRTQARIIQEFNYVNSLGLLNYYLHANLEQIGIQTFAVLQFENHNKVQKNDEFMVNPVFAKRNGVIIPSLYGLGNIPFCDFLNVFSDYDKNRSKSLIFKYLTEADGISGCVLYEGDENLGPYLGPIIVAIGQSLSRVREIEEKNRRAEYLEQEVQKRTAELMEANNRRIEVEAQVLQVSELERQRFSTDLHDDICQRLAGISMLCRSYAAQEKPVQKNQIEELATLVSDTLQRTRQYAHNSYPVDLNTLGLNASLSNLCASFSHTDSIPCEYNWLLPKDFQFDSTEKLNVFRIIQEALHNISKHAQADFVKVTLKNEGDFTLVTIIDDGKGIDQDILSESKRGLGLSSMQYRADQIEADFCIKKNIPKGTCVELKIHHK